MIYLPFAVSYGVNVTEEPKVLRAQFGDGYLQASADGINNNPQKWSVQFDVETDAQALEIFEFFRSLGGTTPFYWNTPNSAWTVTGGGIGVGDNSRTVFQLQRTARGSVASDAWSGVWPTYSVPRTNLLLQTEDLNNAATTKVASAITVNAALAPDGNLTMDFIKEDNTNNSHGCYQLVSNTSSGTFTLSRFFRPGTRTKVNWGITTNGETSRVYATFDLSNGTIVTAASVGGSAILSSPSASIVLQSDGSYRCSVTATANGTQTQLGEYIRMVDGSGATTYAGDNTSGLYAWGVQMEAGSLATRYIPNTTTATTVTPLYWPQRGEGFQPVLFHTPSTLQVYVAGVLKTRGTDYTVGSTGLITFTAAPATGAVVSFTASGVDRRQFTGRNWRRGFQNYNNNTVSVEFVEDFTP